MQKTCQELKSGGFTEISTLECLNREFQVRKITLPVFDTSLDLLAASRKRKLEDSEVARKRFRIGEEERECAYYDSVNPGGKKNYTVLCNYLPTDLQPIPVRKGERRKRVRARLRLSAAAS